MTQKRPQQSEPMLELTEVQIISVSGGKGGPPVVEHHSISNGFLKIKLTETG